MDVGEETVADRLALLDWRRRVFALYAQIRAARRPERAWESWRATRDELFSTHPSSPLPAAGRVAFGGLDYFAYDPGWRVHAELVATPLHPVSIGTSGQAPLAGECFARAEFELGGVPQSLELHWLAGYAGGLLVAFADATSSAETYGGGRYLLDTVKGADLGTAGGRLVLDFNFAYNPSCCYDPRWLCPLAPPANRLAVEVRAGERLPQGGSGPKPAPASRR